MTISYYTKKDIKYLIDEENSSIKITSLKNPLKITGTRFGAILGKNPYKSPFQAWCEIFNLYEEKEFPKEKYWYNYLFDFLKDFFFGLNKSYSHKTVGKIIERKIITYSKNVFFSDPNYHIIIPKEDSSYDFFPKYAIFGGRWDALLYNKKYKKVESILEIKTTSLNNRKDWIQKKIPEQYLLQSSFYAYLSKVKTVHIIVAFLNEKDYLYPKNFIPGKHDVLDYQFHLKDQYPYFSDLIQLSKNWWNQYVLSKKSPPLQSEKDRKILEIIRVSSKFQGRN